MLPKATQLPSARPLISLCERRSLLSFLSSTVRISVISNTYSESLQSFLTTNSDHFGLIKQSSSFIMCGLICIILTELVKAAVT